MGRLNRRLFTPEGILLAGFFITTAFGTLAASDETVHPDSWVYPALRRFELLGLVALAPSVPYTRSQVEFYLDRILAGLEGGGAELSAHQAFLLGRLQWEFQGTAAKPDLREDPPLYTYREGRRFFAVDFATGGVVQKRADSGKGEANGLLIPNFLLDLGWRTTVETTYRLELAPERELNRRKRKPAPRQRSFRGLTAEYERAYVALRGAHWGARIGRDYLHWGSGRSEGLILSRSAGSMDHISAFVQLGRFTLSTFQAVLDSELSRRLAGHRLEVRLPRNVFVGISETVLYAGRDIDFAYLLPLGSFYGNQYNEAGNDNILWSLDVKAPLGRGLIVYSEFLIDDFQYEDDPPAPNRIAFDLAVESLLEFGGLELGLLLEYTFVDIYTYAHCDSLHTPYVSGGGDPTVDYLIGSPLGPDADRWRFRAEIPVHRRVVVAAEGVLERAGEGGDLRTWIPGDDPDPPFPSGRILKERSIAFEGGVDLGRGSLIRAGGGIRSRSGGPDSIDDEDVFCYLEVILDW